MSKRRDSEERLSGLTQAASVSMCILLLSVLVGCGDDKKPNTPGTDWSLGDATTYAVESSEETAVNDSVTGQKFLFPEGGNGSLVIRPIVSGPEAPYEGIGFNVAFDEQAPMALIVDPTGSDQVIVLGYGTAPGLYDDIPGPTERWIAMPCVDSVESGLAFQLTLPFTATGKIAAANTGFSNYWISSIPAGSSDATKRIALELQSKDFVDDILSRFSPSREVAARAEVNGRLSPHYAWDGFLYSGFWWRSLGSMGRIVRPTIHVRLTADAGNVAHETGHYLTHVLVGDDVYSTLEGQAPLWDNGHGPRDEVGREMLVEDYAYFMEWLSVGSVKSYDLLNPYVIFGGMSPLTDDFPGTEGFAAVVLASLTRTTPTVRNLISGNIEDVPVIGLSEAQVFEVIATGPTGIEELHERITTAVGAEAEKLPAMMQRIGWRHSVRGRLLTPEGQPLVGATVSSVSVVGDHVYRGGSSSIPTGSDGKFTITGEVFPGASNIRVWNGEDSIDVPITIPWSQETNKTFDLGDLRVERQLDLSVLRSCAIDLATDANFVFTGGSQYRHERVELPWAHSYPFPSRLYGSFSGGQFTAESDITHDNLHVTIQLTATVDPQSGNLLTLDVIQTYAVDDESSYDDDWFETLELSVHDIPFVGYFGTPPTTSVMMQCSIEGEATCQQITNYTWSGADTDYSSSMTSYDCVPDPPDLGTSYFTIYFYSD